MTAAAHQAARRARARSQGACGQCCKRPAIAGHFRCVECTAHHRKRIMPAPKQLAPIRNPPQRAEMSVRGETFARVKAEAKRRGLTLRAMIEQMLDGVGEQ